MNNRLNTLRRRLLLLPLACGLLVACSSQAAAEGLAVTSPARQDPVRYADEILPLLAANCTACHNQKIREGGLSMDTGERLLAGGDSGPAVVAGKPAESPLFLRASHRQGDPMPPADNDVGARNLSPEQLGLLERWIAEGSRTDVGTAAPISWRPLPPGQGGVLAVAMSADGQVTAAARGGRVSLFDTATGDLLGRLLDSRLATLGHELAHADLITSATFSPVEDLLATGSFRAIKLWKREPLQRLAQLPETAGSTINGTDRSGRWLISARPDGRLALFDLASPQPGQPPRLFGLPGPAITAITVMADGQTAFVSAADKIVTGYRLADGGAIGRLARPTDVSALAVSPDGSRLVTAEADGMLRVWQLPLPEAATDPQAVTPQQQVAAASPVVGLTLLVTPPGHLLAGCGDGVVRLWNLEGGSVVRQFAHGGPMNGLAVSPDGSRLVTVGTAPGYKLWNVADGKLIAHVSGDPRITSRLAARDADIAVLKQDVEFAKGELAAAEKAKETAATEAKETAEKHAASAKTLGEKKAALQAAIAEREAADKAAAAAPGAVPLAEAAHAAAVKSAAAAAAGLEAAQAALAAFEKAVAGQPQAAEAIKPLQATVQTATATRTAADQAASKAAQEIELAKKRVTDTAAALPAKQQAETAAREAETKARMAAETAERAQEFAAAAVARTTEAVPLRQAEQQAVQERLAQAEAARTEADQARAAAERPLAAAAFTPDGRLLLAVDPTGLLLVGGGSDGQPRRTLDISKQVTTIVGGPQGRIALLGGSTPGSVASIIDRWSLVRTIGGEKTPAAMDEDAAGPPVDAVLALAFSPDGSLLASGSGRASRSGEIKLWKTADGSLVRSLPLPHSDTVVALAFSRQGDRLASGGTDRFAKVHLVADGTLERSFEGHTGHVLGVAWQSHGRRLVTAGADNSLKVWNVLTGEQQRTITGPSREVTGVRFLGTGDEILAVSGESTVRIFNAASGAAVRQLGKAGDFVQSVALQGQTLAAGSQDGQLRIWNITQADPLRTLEPSPAAAP
jgi:WD40 repeat protein